MKRQIIAGTSIIACVALCAAVWPRSVQVEKLPVEPVINATNAEIEARAEETPDIFISAETPAPETEPVAISEPEATGITAEKESEKPTPTQTAQAAKPSSSSSEAHMGDVRVVDGEKQIYILGFGWIKDEGGGSVGTVAEDMYENGRKIGVMDGGTTVGNPGDQLTGRKVGIMGGGTTIDGKGNINKMVGVMGADASVQHGTTPPPSVPPEITGDVIYTELQPPVTKASTPPPYKPNGEPYTP